MLSIVMTYISKKASFLHNRVIFYLMIELLYCLLTTDSGNSVELQIWKRVSYQSSQIKRCGFFEFGPSYLVLD